MEELLKEERAGWRDEKSRGRRRQSRLMGVMEEEERRLRGSAPRLSKCSPERRTVAGGRVSRVRREGRDVS